MKIKEIIVIGVERKNAIKEIVSTFVVAMLFTITFRIFFYDPFHVPSGSMMPTLLPGDKMLVEKFAYGYNRHSFPRYFIPFEGRFFAKTPKRGDVVVFALPSDPHTFYVKRVIGIPGDIVNVHNNVVSINNIENKKVLLESVKWLEYKDIFKQKQRVPLSNYLQRELDMFDEITQEGRRYQVLTFQTPGASTNFPSKKIPSGYVFVMGDNRDNSLDSRFPAVGFIPLDHIVGKSVIIFFSAEDGLLGALLNPKTLRIDRMFKSVNAKKLQDTNVGNTNREVII